MICLGAELTLVPVDDKTISELKKQKCRVQQIDHQGGTVSYADKESWPVIGSPLTSMGPLAICRTT